MYKAKLIFATFALSGLLAVPASAAETSWAGFYAGANVGYSIGPSDTTQTLSGGAVSFAGSSTLNLDGVLGGFQIGYNWTLSNRWIAGLETDFQFAGQDGSSTVTCAAAACNPGGLTFNPANNLTLSEKLKWFGTLRGRIGMSVSPAWMVYGTGGLAYGQVNWTDTLTGSSGPAAATAVFNGNSTKAGWTIGIGTETMIAANWALKVEYLYIDLGAVSAGPLSTTPVLIGGAVGSYGFSSHITDNVVRIGVNYRFGS